MDFLHFASTERYVEGIISSVEDESVIIDLKLGLGLIRFPKKYIISKNEIKEGQVVGFLASFPEVIFDGVDNEHIIESKKKIRNILENMVMKKTAS